MLAVPPSGGMRPTAFLSPVRMTREWRLSPFGMTIGGHRGAPGPRVPPRTRTAGTRIPGPGSGWGGRASRPSPAPRTGRWQRLVASRQRAATTTWGRARQKVLQNRPAPGSSQGDGRVPRRGSLDVGQRAIGRTEPQGERQRTMSGRHLTAGEDVEEVDRLQEFAGALRQRPLDVPRRSPCRPPRAPRPPWPRDDPRPAGSTPPLGASRSSASRSSSTAAVRAGSPKARTTSGCSSPAWPITSPPTTSSAQRPGCQGATVGLPALDVGSHGAGGHVGEGEGLRASLRPSPAPSQPARRHWPHSTAARWRGCRGRAASMAASSAARRALVHGRDRRRLTGTGEEHRTRLVQGEVVVAARGVAVHRTEQSRAGSTCAGTAGSPRAGWPGARARAVRPRRARPSGRGPRSSRTGT